MKAFSLIVKLKTFQELDRHGPKAAGTAGWPHGASHGAEGEEGNIKRWSQGLRKGKSQNGIGEELLLRRTVPGIAQNQVIKHHSNANPDPAMTAVVAPTPINIAAMSMSQGEKKNSGV